MANLAVRLRRTAQSMYFYIQQARLHQLLQLGKTVVRGLRIQTGLQRQHGGLSLVARHVMKIIEHADGAPVRIYIALKAPTVAQQLTGRLPQASKPVSITRAIFCITVVFPCFIRKVNYRSCQKYGKPHLRLSPVLHLTTLKSPCAARQPGPHPQTDWGKNRIRPDNKPFGEKNREE